jgi:drug/metabolite transporter (DMT)-like permease
MEEPIHIAWNCMNPPDASGLAKGRATANLMCMLSMLVWSMGLPAADLLIGRVPSLPLTAARMALACACLLPIWWLREGGAVLRAAAWRKGIAIGGSTLGLGAFLMVAAQSMTDAVTVAIISASMPVVGIGLEVLLDGRRITPGLMVGLVCSLAGGLLALDGRAEQVGLGWGALLCFASVLVYTWGSRMSVTSFPDLTPLGRTTITLCGAALVSTCATLVHTALGGASPQWERIGWTQLAALAVFAIGGMALSQLLWIRAVGHIGIALSSLHINATPFYVMLMLFAMGGDWNWSQALAAAIVGLGVLISQDLIPVGRRRPPN